MSSEIDDVIVLTSFAWEGRYPGLSELMSEEENQEALRHVEPLSTGRKGRLASE